MKCHLPFILVLMLVFVFQNNANAQLGSALKNKIKTAAKSALEDELKGGTNKEIEEEPLSPEEPANNPTAKGKKLTPPSVTNHLDGAKSSLQNEQYTNARFDVKEAMRGVELEIGYAILEAMPKKVDELVFDENNDGVTSTGTGFAGLVISRVYENNDEKQMTASIGNNSALGASYNMLISSGYSANDGNHKNVTVQGNRGTLTFDDYSTYTLGVPFGQNSIFVLECSGCNDEEEVLSASNSFDINRFDELLKNEESDATIGTGADIHLNSASSSYSSKDLESTRYSLQRALEEIDILIGQKILEMLPTEIAGLKSSPDADEHIASAAGFAGIYIERFYFSTDTLKQMEITLVDDSPLISMINAFVNTPMVMGMSGKKSIKIDGYKGMYEQVENADPKEITINIPSNQSLLTMRFTGMDDASASDAANKVPVGAIFKLLK